MTKKITKNLRSLFTASVFCLFGMLGFSQTLLIDPNLEGGFDLGPTFADNGWTVVNSTTSGAGLWYQTNVPLTNGGYSFTPNGSNAAFISNDLGLNWAYTNTIAGTSHFYRDVNFPAGETAINLSFNFNSNGETSYDELQVYLCPTTLTPLVNSPTGTSTSPTWSGTGTPIFLGRYSLITAGAGTLINLPIPPAIVGNCSSSVTWRLVFTWKEDTSGGTNPPAAIDDISLISAPSPITLAGGVFTIDNTIATGGTNFQSFTEAIYALNAASVCGLFTNPVVFNVTSGQTFAELTPAITASGSALNAITFQKSGAGANPIITPTGTSATTDAGISIFGGDYITFDGIDINASAVSNVEFGYLLRNAAATNGAQYNTIKNCSITLNRTNTSSRGFSSSLPTTPTSIAGANSNNAYLNFTIKNVSAGIQLVGNATYPDLNTTIGTTNCTIFNSIGDPSQSNDIGNTTTTTYGISVSNQSGFNIFNNSIRNVTNTGGQADGIVIATFQGVSSVYNNSIQGIRNSGTSSTSLVSGMRASHTTTGTHTLRIYNNTISGITSGYTGTATATRVIKGIFINGTGGATTQNYQIHNNTVSIDGSSSLTNSSVCFEISTTSGPVYNLSNNIFANFTAAQTGVAKHYGLFSTSATVFGPAGTLSNNNDIFIANDINTSGFAGIGNTTNYATIAAWTAVMTPAGQEAASISSDPLFLNNTSDLHASALTLNNSGSIPAAFVTTDFECAARTDNDMGAYNLVACSGTPTAGAVSGINTLCSGLNTNLTLSGASSEAGISYQWASSTTPGGPYTTLLGTSLVQNTGAVTTPTYYVAITTCSVSGLSATTAEHTITVNSLPTVAVSPTSGLICVPGGASIPLTASGTATTYTWAPVNGLSTTTGTSTIANPTATTTYVVTGTDAIGCTATASSVITVAMNPVIASITATPDAVCSGGSSQLNVNATLPLLLISEVTVFRTGTGATASYPAFATGADLVEITNISSAPIDISGYTLSAYANNNGTASHTFTFPAGTIIPNSAVAVVCLGTGTNDLANRYFNTGGSNDSYSSTSQVGVVLKNGATIVDAVGLGGSLTGSYTFNVGIGVTASDFTGFAPNASGLAGSRRTFSMDNNIGTDWTASGASNLQTIGTYDAIYALTGTITDFWSPATFLNDPTIANPLASGITTTTTYTVTATSSSTCSSTGTVTVSQGVPLTSNVTASPNASVCAGTNVTLQAIPAGGGAPYTYAWTGPNSFASSAQNPTLTGVTALEDGVYTVVISDNCGSTSTSTVALTVNALPVMVVTPTTAMYCAPGTAVTMSASGADTYSWSPATGLSATTGATVEASPSANTTYTVTGTTSFGCTSSTTATINSANTPVILSTSSNPSMLCYGGNSQLNVNVATTMVKNYQFTAGTGSTLDPMLGATTVIANGIDDTPTATPSNIGFSFDFNGVTYTQYSVSPDGWILLGGATAASQFTNAVTSTTNVPKIYPFWDDLATGTNGNVQTLVTGTAPNRIFKVQWNVTVPRNTSGAANSTFQAWLYETSNSIEFRYGTMGIPTSGSISAGLTGSATNYNSITYTSNTSSSATSNDINAVAPASGTIYTYTQPAYTFAWTPIALLNSGSIQNPQVIGATSSETYSVNVISSDGCSATGSVAISVLPQLTSTVSVSPSSTICSGTDVTLQSTPVGGGAVYTYSWTGPNSFTSTSQSPLIPSVSAINAGIYTVVVTDSCGATSTNSVNLSVLSPSVNTISPISCNSYTSPNGSIYTTSGTYTNVIPNAVGCDSTITINLTINNSTTSTLNPVVCGSYTSPNGSVYTTSGTYTNVIPNASGCDSTITINLVVYGNSASTISPVVCNTYTSPNGSVYTTSGTYTNVIPNFIGCDSTITINLTVNNSPSISAGNDLTVCQNGQVTLFGSGAAIYTWDNGVTNGVPFVALSTTTYTLTGTSAAGCTSTDVVTVTVNPLPLVEAGANISQCGDQNVTLSGSGAQVYTWNNGVIDGVSFNAPFGTTSYIVTGVDAFGCANNDVVTVVIGEVPVATATAVDALSITASPANSFYQWIDCSTNAPIFGATESTFTATENGSYAVIVTSLDGCSDTSACVVIDEVGLTNLTDEISMTVYPNPTNGKLNVSLSSIEKVNITVFDAQGKLIQTLVDAENKSIIDLSNVEPGVYMIHMNSESTSSIQRIVKN